MKNLNIILAVIGGAVAGAAVGLLAAPNKGADTRSKIKDFIQSKGLNLKKSQLDKLVDEIADEIKK